MGEAGAASGITNNDTSIWKLRAWARLEELAEQAMEPVPNEGAPGKIDESVDFLKV